MPLTGESSGIISEHPKLRLIFTSVALLISIYEPTISAQQPQASPVDIPPQTATPQDTTTNPVTLARPLEQGSRNFVNFYAFGNGVYDSTFPVYQSGQFNNPTADQGAWGYESAAP